jgi:hypothetical protein
VARETPVRIGKKFRMSVFGEPLAPWGLAASPGAASIPLPPFGTLQLNPAKLWILAGGVLPASGEVELDVPLGPNPALLGLNVHWQALVGMPLQFTAREVATVTGF